MADTQLTLSSEEREYLIAILETALQQSRIEEHRTRTLTYREHIVHREDLIADLLNKLGQPSK